MEVKDQQSHIGMFPIGFKMHCMRNPGTDGNLYIRISSFYMEIIRKTYGQVSAYTLFCLDLSCIAS